MELTLICTDSLPAELLKHGGPNLVDALHELIHHSQDLDPLSPALRQSDVGVDQKGGELIARF
jgi:hypothetical protein